jgi:hypothetical protein
MTAPQSPVRPRLSGRDILPILATGLIVAGAILAADRAFTPQGMAGALAMGTGFMLAVAGIQGRAEALTSRGAFVAWIKLTFIAVVVLLATGRLAEHDALQRLGIVLVTSLGASLLLFLLRTRRR